MTDKLDYQVAWIEFWICVFCIPISVIFLPWYVAFASIALLMVAAYLTLLDITSVEIKKRQEEWGLFRKTSATYKRLHEQEAS